MKVHINNQTRLKRVECNRILGFFVSEKKYMSRKDSGNFIKIVDGAVATYEIVDTDTRKYFSLIHGINNLHVSPIR